MAKFSKTTQAPVKTETKNKVVKKGLRRKARKNQAIAQTFQWIVKRRGVVFGTGSMRGKKTGKAGGGFREHNRGSLTYSSSDKTQEKGVVVGIGSAIQSGSSRKNCPVRKSWGSPLPPRVKKEDRPITHGIWFPPILECLSAHCRKSLWGLVSKPTTRSDHGKKGEKEVCVRP